MSKAVQWILSAQWIHKSLLVSVYTPHRMWYSKLIEKHHILGRGNLFCMM